MSKPMSLGVVQSRCASRGAVLVCICANIFQTVFARCSLQLQALLKASNPWQPALKWVMERPCLACGGHHTAPRAIHARRSTKKHEEVCGRVCAQAAARGLEVLLPPKSSRAPSFLLFLTFGLLLPLIHFSKHVGLGAHGHAVRTEGGSQYHQLELCSVIGGRSASRCACREHSGRQCAGNAVLYPVQHSDGVASTWCSARSRTCLSHTVLVLGAQDSSQTPIRSVPWRLDWTSSLCTMAVLMLCLARQPRTFPRMATPGPWNATMVSTVASCQSSRRISAPSYSQRPRGANAPRACGSLPQLNTITAGMPTTTWLIL